MTVLLPFRLVFFADDCFFVTFCTGVAAFAIAIFLPLRVVFPLGVAGAGDDTDSLTGLSTFFGDGFAPFRLVFFAGVAALGVAAFLPLRVDLPLGVAGTNGEASVFSGLAVFDGVATLAGDLAPRFPRVAPLGRDDGFWRCYFFAPTCSFCFRK